MRPPTMDQVEQQIRAAMDADDWAAVEHYGVILDTLQALQDPPGLLPSALWYAQHGWPVFQLQPGMKTPYSGSRGFKDATTDPATITHWWTRNPNANIGIATGHGFDVIDVDGPLGVRTWLDMWDDIASLGIIGKVSTTRPGGIHLYVPVSGRGCKAGVYPGIDYRGAGGYVVAPPSRLIDAPGQTPGEYHWLTPPSTAVAA